MPEATSAASTRARRARRQSVPADVKELHRRCGVYTKAEVVCRILDAIDWRESVDLSQACLLEPAAGDGAFIVEAARRLVASLKRRRIKLTAKSLLRRIVAYELHPDEAKCARERVVNVLREAGLHHQTALACARAWIIAGDFLLADLPLDCFTHAAGNPPYVRWSKVPAKLKEQYETILPSDVTVGDLFLPFLDRTLQFLKPGGRFGFLCSDRWRFMGFAESFRQKWLPSLSIISETTLSASDAFVSDVDSYPTILIAVRRRNKKTKPRVRLRHRKKTLTELGCIVKVGPALGHTAAFVLEADEDDVEAELLRPWIEASDIRNGFIKRRGRRVVTMYDKDGKLINPKNYPLLMARLKRFTKQLQKRSIVKSGAKWFRTIDRVIANDWKRPKLLIPELAKVPRVTIDRSGAIPSHGVYAIFAPDDDVEGIYEKLRDGKLAKALNRIAPKVKGGYVRCYKRFLSKIELSGLRST